MRLVKDKLDFVDKEKIKNDIIDEIKSIFLSKYPTDAMSMADIELTSDSSDLQDSVNNFLDNSVE